MQIVIEIDEQDYVYIAKKHCLPSCDDETLRKNVYEMVAKGIPLPEKHGDLIDADMTMEMLCMDKCRVVPHECPYTLNCNARHVIDKMVEHAIVPAR